MTTASLTSGNPPERFQTSARLTGSGVYDPHGGTRYLLPHHPMTAHSHAAPAATRPVLQSLYPLDQIQSFCAYREYAEKTKEEEEAEKKEADDKKAEEEKAEAEKKEKEEKDKKGSAEERVTNALKERDEAKAALQKKEDEDKKAKEESLKADGKKDELIILKDAEVTKQKDEIDKLKDEIKDKGEQLTNAEKEAETEVQAAIETIKDKDKKKIVEEALEGKTAFQQRKSLAGLLKLAGVKTTGKSVGAGMPGDGSEGTSTADEDEDAYRVLHEKSQKHISSGGDALTPTERKEYRVLGTKIRKAREAKKKEEDDEELTIH